jgi:hypothetical protein
MRRLSRIMAVAMMAVALASGAAAASAAPSTGHIANWLTNLSATDEGHSIPVRVLNASQNNVSFYIAVNCQRWTDPDGVIVGVCEWQDGSGMCLNVAGNLTYSDGCSKGDANELYYIRTCCYSTGYWLINAGYVNRYGDHAWYYATQTTGDTTISEYGPGYGNQAVWYFW